MYVDIVTEVHNTNWKKVSFSWYTRLLIL